MRPSYSLDAGVESLTAYPTSPASPSPIAMFGGVLDIKLLMWINTKRPHGDALCPGRVHLVQGRFDMSAITKSEMVSRRKVVSLVGLAAAVGFAAVPTVLAVSDAEAQTLGMERRQDRREGRQQRRDDRRTGRTERREERRTGTAAGAAPAGTAAGAAPAGTTTGSAK